MRTTKTRQRILKAAQHLIEEGGLARLTTKEIARAAQCAEGTLFKHFRTKEDLCLAVVVENAPNFRELLTRKRSGELTVERNLQDIALACIQFSEKLIPLGATLFADAALLERHRRETQRRGGGPTETFGLIAAYIEGEQQLGRIRRDIDPLQAALALFGPCFQRAFLRQALGKKPFSVTDSEFAAGIVGILLRGLSP